jgi:hypothetical protein
MDAMKLRLVVLLLGASLLPAVQARATILPDACGPDNVKFDVKTTEQNLATPAPAPPEAGKAQIVFIESLWPNCNYGCGIVARYGMDGAWIGANKGNSFFSLSVAPGTHHLCVSIQGGGLQGNAFTKIGIDMASFSAEPGKVYYFAAEFNVIRSGGGGVTQFALSPLDEDTGKFRVKSSKLATSTPKK